MWITFKSCIFAFWNNGKMLKQYLRLVVNYIQILYLCILKQLTVGEGAKFYGCELHSNLVSLHSETTTIAETPFFDMLWITFKSCIFAFWNNPIRSGNACPVGCELHSNLVSLHSETTQYHPLSCRQGCELHSNLVSLHSETTSHSTRGYGWKLWITFKSCIFAFWNNL